MSKTNINLIKTRFLEQYPDSKTELMYKNIYELLVCVMLSAQCTDKRVNIITPPLFGNYPDIEALSTAELEDIKKLIGSCSFFNNKAKNLLAMAKKCVDEFCGEVPLEFEALKSLPGVGQKTANVVLIEYKGENKMAVDTHVFRVSHRLGLSKANTPEKVEADLTKKFKTDLDKLHQAMVLFGRYRCKAQKPQCYDCFFGDICKAKVNTPVSK